jgi:glycosyltransferase involved in cell wall biosynthesis
MKIVAAAFFYNERKYIEEFVEYYKSQGCELLIIDNHSTDGTKEYLDSKGIKNVICRTGGTFDLKKLQAALIQLIREEKPEWVVYTGCDVFYHFGKKTIRDIITEVDSHYNMIGVKYYNAYNTGEERGRLRETYYYGKHLGRLYMIAKYSEPFGFEADSIQIKNKKIHESEGILVNYGNCKPAEEREDTFKRRKLAWQRGLDRNYGVHYIKGHEKGWLWDREELINFKDEINKLT